MTLNLIAVNYNVVGVVLSVLSEAVVTVVATVVLQPAEIQIVIV